MREAVIVSTARTPIGKAYRGAFNNTSAQALGGHGVAISDRESLKREAQRAFGRAGFTLLACRIDASDYEGAF